MQCMRVTCALMSIGGFDVVKNLRVDVHRKEAELITLQWTGRHQEQEALM